METNTDGVSANTKWLVIIFVVIPVALGIVIGMASS
jgi:hypothetical protein